MASTVLFVVMVIIGAILLFVASLTATLGAINVFGSSLYEVDPRLKSSHRYLTISAALGWSALAILIVILIIAAIAGGFTSVEVSDALLTKTNPTKEDLLAAYRGEKDLSSGHITQIIVIIILIMIAIVTLVVGIFSAIAAVELGGMRRRDQNTDNAYIESIISAVAGIGGIGIMIVAIIAYISIRSTRSKKLKEIVAFEKRAEVQLGVVPGNITGVITKK